MTRSKRKLFDKNPDGTQLCLRVIGCFVQPSHVRAKNLQRFFVSALATLALSSHCGAEVLEGTRRLTMQGDIASELVSGVDRFLLNKLRESPEQRERHWHRDFSSEQAYTKSIEPKRQRLAHILGVRDRRVPFEAPQLLATTDRPAHVARTELFDVYEVRWPAIGDVHAEGLLLAPRKESIASVVAIPDVGQTPEQIVGLRAGVAPQSQFARRLAESGCRVLVPVLINRNHPVLNKPQLTNLTNREYLYRSAFELGRHLIGYEVQKVLAAVDWFERDDQDRRSVGVIGWGEGGLLALYAGALDTRIDAVCVSGYFDRRENIWQEPLDRNVFGLLEQFGDAELASMVVPGKLIVEAARGPEATLAGGRGAPARVLTPKLDDVKREVQRAGELVGPLSAAIELITSDDGAGEYGTESALAAFLDALSGHAQLAELGQTPTSLVPTVDAAARHARQFHEIERHNQRLLLESPFVRQKYMSRLNTESLDQFADTIEWYRTHFREEVIGRFDLKLLPANVRTRRVYDEEQWTGYEVVMDVFPDVIAYGILLLPKDLQPGEKRPVVVCQHGLEGRPQDVIGQQGYRAYKAFAARLAERGFITFAPQNLYIFRDRFRTLQRKANPLKKTLFSIIVPQHQQIVDWLQTLPYVDPERIAFYGLSYGGKTAMRVPPLVADYCLSICSADFNEWVDKNASTVNPHSYMNTGEYEIFEFDLGSTFNYAEMAALIAPRPFMVERGHFDGVASDETVGWEFAKVRHLYAAKLGIGDRCQIEWFVGPHTINGQGTFAFLHKHLKWHK